MEMQKSTVRILTDQEMEQIAGGHPFEEKFADYALYRAGITCNMHFFSSDEFLIGSTKISKALAKTLRDYSKKVWANFSATGDYVNYARVWKAILLTEYGISWNGEMGSLIGYCD